MKTSFRIVALVLMLTVLCTACILAVFASSPDTATEESIPAKNQIIQQINCDLRISGSTAVLLSDVKGTAGSTTKCEIELKLQKKFMFWWTTVETWNKTALSYQTSLNATHSVESGKTYRAVAVCTVWNGSSSETATAASASVEAP